MPMGRIPEQSVKAPAERVQLSTYGCCTKETRVWDHGQLVFHNIV